MTITYKKISHETFFGVDALTQMQRDVWEDYLGTDKPFVTNFGGRKGWESKYDPKFTGGKASPTPTVPDVSTLPAKKWVKRRLPTDREEAFQFAEDCDAWLKEFKVKHQTCLVMLDGKPTWVHLFKKTKDALMFKLTWG